jgi:hypothetical protein
MNGTLLVTPPELAARFAHARVANPDSTYAAAAARASSNAPSSVPSFERSTFDAIFCRAAFKNFSEPVMALTEMGRVLKTGAQALSPR